MIVLAKAQAPFVAFSRKLFGLYTIDRLWKRAEPVD